MATANFKNDGLNQISNTKDTWPKSTTKTGQMSYTAGSNRVMGVTNIAYNTIVVGAVPAGAAVFFSNGGNAIAVLDDGVSLLKIISYVGPALVAGVTYLTTAGRGATVVTPTPTKFLTELKQGDWLVDFANNEIRKIVQIMSDDNLTVDYPFSNTATSAVITTQGSVNVEMSILCTPNAGVVDGTPLPANVGFSWGKQGRDSSGIKDFVYPIIVDATGTVAVVSVTK